MNIEDLDLASRRCRGKARGAKSKSRRRGQVREDFVLETVYWDAGTARLLPRLLKGRARGPVFVTHRRPGPGKVVSSRDVCPDTGLARLSYGQARALLDAHTAVRGPGTGWDLHEYRHSALTHLGEQGASLLMLMAKSRTRSRRTCAATSSRRPRRSPKSPVSWPPGTAAAEPGSAPCGHRGSPGPNRIPLFNCGDRQRCDLRLLRQSRLTPSTWRRSCVAMATRKSARSGAAAAPCPWSRAAPISIMASRAAV